MIEVLQQQDQLHIECNNEELSEAQIDHRKRQLENLILIQEALQLYFKDKDSGLPTIESGSINGGNSLASFVNSEFIKNGKGASSQFQPLMLSKQGNEKNEVNTSKTRTAGKRKYSCAQSPPEQEEPSAKKPSITPPSLTQTLRATRKTTGSLHNPVVSYAPDEDSDVEVIQERRPITIGPKGAGAGSNIAGFRNIAPKAYPSATNIRGANKSAKRSPTKPNNILLLNINVRPRNAASVVVNAAKRKDLDAQVKVILMKSPSEFIEYLLKQGLIRSIQYCLAHKTNKQPNKLKLGKFQDPKLLASSKLLANSGGYVWIGDCCSKKYISAFSGSVFGHAPIEEIQPTSLLKLIYHWSCQTSIANVETWVKVDKQFISKVYNYFRCICSVMLHDKIYDFGFEGSKIELGIVSLGTTTADGSKKAVKVEILGLFDRKNKSYRLFASTPETATSSKERFLRILKPVKDVVHRNAIIICDQSVDPACLNAMNFCKVEVCKTSDDETNLATNSTIMFYLRKHVPKMFQAALSQLTENQVQLTLDELCWREKFAATSSFCFTNIMDNIAYLTFMEQENPGLVPLLEYIADNPHNNFRYKNQPMNKSTPVVPTFTLISPTSGPMVVTPTQHVECRVANPRSHQNKIMTKNIQFPESETLPSFSTPSPSYNPGTVSSYTSIPNNRTTLKNLEVNTSFSPQPLSNCFTTIPLNSPMFNSKAVNIAPKQELSSQSMDIEPYFYGRIDGNTNSGQYQNTCLFKCHLCSDTFDDNINFYSHIKYHIEGITAEKTKLDYICPYCNEFFLTINGLNKHKIDIHLMSDLTQMWCRICAERFTSKMLFKMHMTKLHVESELPYRCEICQYATSFYYDIINHFNKNHRRTPYVQCHICLNVKTIVPDGSLSFSTRLYQHMQKHVQNKLYCFSCCLSFYSKYLLNEHKKDHLSCANVNGVKRYVSPSGHKAIFFSPTDESKNVVGPVNLPLKLTHNLAALSITLHDHQNLVTNFMSTKYYCIECDAPLHVENHYKKYQKCTQCAYSTCCPNMIVRHAEIFHPTGDSTKQLLYFIGAPIPLPSPLFCFCGFSAKSGHQLAKHLALCSVSVKKTAYSGLENANINDASDTVDDDARSLFAHVEPMDTDSVVPIMPLSVELHEDVSEEKEINFNEL